MDFDPDKYLGNQQEAPANAGAFSPDAYLAGSATAPATTAPEGAFDVEDYVQKERKAKRQAAVEERERVLKSTPIAAWGRIAEEKPLYQVGEGGGITLPPGKDAGKALAQAVNYGDVREDMARQHLEAAGFVRRKDAKAGEDFDLEAGYEWKPGFSFKKDRIVFDDVEEAIPALNRAVRGGFLKPEEARAALESQLADDGDGKKYALPQTGSDVLPYHFLPTGERTGDADFDLRKEYRRTDKDAQTLKPKGIELGIPSEAWHRNSAWHQDPYFMGAQALRFGAMPAAAAVAASTGVGLPASVAIMAAAAGAGEAGAEAMEKDMGLREGYSPAAIGVSMLAAAGGQAWAAKTLGMSTSLIKTAGVRVGQNVTIGTSASVATQLIEEGHVDAGEVMRAAGVSALFALFFVPFEVSGRRAYLRKVSEQIDEVRAATTKVDAGKGVKSDEAPRAKTFEEMEQNVLNTINAAYFQNFKTVNEAYSWLQSKEGGKFVSDMKAGTLQVFDREGNQVYGPKRTKWDEAPAAEGEVYQEGTAPVAAKGEEAGLAPEATAPVAPVAPEATAPVATAPVAPVASAPGTGTDGQGQAGTQTWEEKMSVGEVAKDAPAKVQSDSLVKKWDKARMNSPMPFGEFEGKALAPFGVTLFEREDGSSLTVVNRPRVYEDRGKWILKTPEGLSGGEFESEFDAWMEWLRFENKHRGKLNATESVATAPVAARQTPAPGELFGSDEVGFNLSSETVAPSKGVAPASDGTGDLFGGGEATGQAPTKLDQHNAEAAAVAALPQEVFSAPGVVDYSLLSREELESLADFPAHAVAARNELAARGTGADGQGQAGTGAGAELAAPDVAAVPSPDSSAAPAVSVPFAGPEIPTYEVPLELLSLSKDVPQFKMGGNEHGEVEPIRGQHYERKGTAPIVVWERADGRLEIITGRHRAAFARRVGEKTIPAQIMRETDGFLKSDALTFDAESNIRDGQGSVKDYANYFRNNPELSAEGASSRGLLARDKGRKGFSIGRNAGESLYIRHLNGGITDGKAAAIADAAPGNDAAQVEGSRFAEKHSEEEVRQFMQAMLSMRPANASEQLDLLGFDTGWQVEAEAMGKAAAGISRGLSAERDALKAAVRLEGKGRAEIVKKYGFNAGDTEAMRARVGVLEGEIAQWENWAVHPELVARVRESAKLPVSGNQSLREEVEARNWAVGESNRQQLLLGLDGSSSLSALPSNGGGYDLGGAGRDHALSFSGRAKDEALSKLARALGTEGSSVSSIVTALVLGERNASALVGLKVNAPKDFAAALGWLRDPLQERAGVAVLNKNNEVIHAEILTVGRLDAVMLSPALVSRAVVNAGKGAKGYIVFHNHPGGDSTGSLADVNLTKQLAKAPIAPGVKFLNHVITNGDTFNSWDGGGFYPGRLDKRHVAKWETVPRGDLGVLDYPDLAFVRDVRASGNKGAIVMYLNTQGRLVAVETTTGKLNSATPKALAEHVAARSAQEGASMVFLDKPGLTPKFLLEFREMSGTAYNVIDGSDYAMSPKTFGQSGNFPRKIRLGEGLASETLREDGPLLSWADKDGFRTEVKLTPAPGFSVVQVPELVAIVRELGLSLSVGKLRGGTRGLFSPVGNGRIKLSAALFRDPALAAMVLAHEMGHAFDWFGDALAGTNKTMTRGNLLGRLGVLNHFLQTTLPKLPAAREGAGDFLQGSERAALRRQVVKAVTAARGPRPAKADDESGWGAWGEEVARRYQEVISAEVTRRGLATLSEVDAELRELSLWWKPFEVSEASADYLDYRFSGVELYADAVSVFLNSPGDVQMRAPLFWEMFRGYLERKPDVMKALSGVQDLYLAGNEAVLKARSERLRKGFEMGAMVFDAHWYARREPTPWRDTLRAAIAQYWNRYHAITRRGAALTASGVKHDVDFFFDEHPLGDNRVALWLHDVERQVQRPLLAAGLTVADLGEYLFYDRIANEEPEFARPGGHSPETAREGLAALLERVSPGGGNGPAAVALQEAAGLARAQFAAVVQEGVAAGLWAPEQVAKWEEAGAAYAPFAALSHFAEDGRVGAGFAKVKGNLGDIIDPFEALVLKGVAIMRRAQINNAKRVAGDLLARYFPTEITRAELLRDSGGREVRAKSPANTKALGTLEFYRAGKLEGWHVPREIETMFDGMSPAKVEAVSNVLNRLFAKIFYPAFISYNPEFLLWTSPMRDLERGFLNVPTVGGKVNVLYQMARNYGSLIFGLPLTQDARLARKLVQGDYDDPVIRELLSAGALQRPHQFFTRQKDAGRAGGSDVLERLLEEYRMLPSSEQKRGFWRTKVQPMVDKLFYPFHFAGQTFEALNKIGPYMYLTRQKGWGQREAAYFVRNYAGIPNTARAGSNIRLAKSIFPFMDVMIRGVAADFGELALGASPLYGRGLAGMGKGKQAGFTGKAAGAAARAAVGAGGHFIRYFFRYLAGVGGLLLLQKLAEEGAMGDELREFYQHIPNYEKSHKLVIPLGMKGVRGVNSEAVYMPVPLDEQVGLINSLVRGAITTAFGGDVSGAAADVVAFGRGNVPGVNPVAQLATNWAIFASGENPRDTFRDRPIVSPAAQEARPVDGAQARADMFWWSLNQSGYMNVVKFDPEAKTTAELAMKGTPFLKRMVKTSDRGLMESQQAQQDVIDAKEAQVRANLAGTVVDRLLREQSLIGSLDRVQVRTPEQNMRGMMLNAWRNGCYVLYRQQLLAAYEAGDKAEVKRLNKELIAESEAFAK